MTASVRRAYDYVSVRCSPYPKQCIDDITVGRIDGNLIDTIDVTDMEIHRIPMLTSVCAFHDASHDPSVVSNVTCVAIYRKVICGNVKF